MDTIERTLIILKPDAVQRSLTGAVISRFERADLQLVALKMIRPTQEMVETHYEEHADKDFFENLVEYLQGKVVVVGVIEGIDAVAVVRKHVGCTEPREAAPGTIRGDFAHVSYEHAEATGKAVKNVVHASATQAEAESEIELWFDKDELHDVRIETMPHRNVG